MASLKAKTISAIKWSSFERISVQAIQLISLLFLGRIIGPEAFGLIGILTIFIAIAQIFVDSGFSNALIRKEDCTESDYSTVFFFNIVIAIVSYLILFFTAPFIASFYDQPILSVLTRVLGFSILINAFSIIQRVLLTKSMDFRTQSKSSFISAIISTSLAVWAALKGLEVWALVIQTTTASLCNSILLNYYVKWHPTTFFSKKSFTPLFSFGSKLLLSGLIDTIYNNIYQLVIGKILSANIVGYFTQARNLTLIPASTFTSIIQRVTYPMMSKLQENNELLKNSYLLTLRLSAAVIFPILIGIAVISKPFINLTLGHEWSQASLLMSILAFGFMLYPIHSINLNLLQVKGRSDLFLRLEIIKKIIGTIILIISIPFGLIAICIGIVIQSHIALLINTYYTSSIINITIKDQFNALFPIWLISIAVGTISWLMTNTITNNIYHIICIMVLIIPSYILTIFFAQKDLFFYLYNATFKKELLHD